MRKPLVIVLKEGADITQVPAHFNLAAAPELALLATERARTYSLQADESVIAHTGHTIAQCAAVQTVVIPAPPHLF